MNTTSLAMEAVRAATILRSEHGIGPNESVCPYDLAIKLGMKVNFLDAPSLEGMYSPEPKPTIILSRERGAGRRRYTCAHEIGHHIFKHGYRIDQLDESNSSPSSPEEYLAQRFASALLMPKIVVDSAFSRRSWKPSEATATQCFIVAQELGVGFSALITNLEANLKTLSKEKANILLRSSVSTLRRDVAGMSVENDIFLIDSGWIRPSIDVEVGDLIIFPKNTQISTALVDEIKAGEYFKAKASGVAEFTEGFRKLTLRISKRGFIGHARYRHLEDVNDV